MDEPAESLSVKDHAVNACQAMLKGIPYVGSSLEQFLFGSLAELRMRRIERTLSEVAEALGSERANSMCNEDFVTLLESIAPDLSRATHEEKRNRFRDLLTNAAILAPQSAEWAETSLATSLLKEIEAPGLAILAAVGRCSKQTDLTLTSRPLSQVFEGRFDYDNPGDAQHVLPYDCVVVEYWARRLREKNIISYSSHDARGGFGGVGLAPLGRFLIRWTMNAQNSAT